VVAAGEARAATAVIACGALGAPIREIATRRGWEIELHSLTPLLHNHPREIAPNAEALARALQMDGRTVVLAYADCGSYGALDELCTRLGIGRLRGLHCYDVFAGVETMQALFADDAGTYVLTDFLVQSFRRTVLSELGLDRRPELWGAYFGNYTRLVWLAQRRSDSLEEKAREVAAMFALPLTILDVGLKRLEIELEELLGNVGAPARGEPVSALRDSGEAAGCAAG
jgi:hypothetical protein